MTLLLPTDSLGYVSCGLDGCRCNSFAYQGDRLAESYEIAAESVSRGSRFSGVVHAKGSLPYSLLLFSRIDLDHDWILSFLESMRICDGVVESLLANSGLSFEHVDSLLRNASLSVESASKLYSFGLLRYVSGEPVNSAGFFFGALNSKGVTVRELIAEAEESSALQDEIYLAVDDYVAHLNLTRDSEELIEIMRDECNERVLGRILSMNLNLSDSVFDSLIMGEYRRGSDSFVLKYLESGLVSVSTLTKLVPESLSNDFIRDVVIQNLEDVFLFPIEPDWDEDRYVLFEALFGECCDSEMPVSWREKIVGMKLSSLSV